MGNVEQYTIRLYVLIYHLEIYHGGGGGKGELGAFGAHIL